MTIHLGIVMDPIQSIKVHKDSSFAMLLAAQRRGWKLSYMEQSGLYQRDGEVFASLRSLRVFDRDHDWFELSGASDQALGQLDVVLMRKDPPLDMNFCTAPICLRGRLNRARWW